MTVKCQIIQSERGYEGVIVNLSGITVYNTGFQGCAEDADGLMECTIIRNGWKVVPWSGPKE